MSMVLRLMRTLTYIEIDNFDLIYLAAVLGGCRFFGCHVCVEWVSGFLFSGEGTQEASGQKGREHWQEKRRYLCTD
jgi:hypothetical protein